MGFLTSFFLFLAVLVVLPAYSQDISLKQQVENNIPVDNIECRNEKHVLTERPNGKLACVYYETSVKLNWIILNTDTHRQLFVYELPVYNVVYDIKYTITNAQILSMEMIENNNSLLVNLDSRKDGELTIHIPTEMIDFISGHDGKSNLFVYINNEKIETTHNINDGIMAVSMKFPHPDPEIKIVMP